MSQSPARFFSAPLHLCERLSLNGQTQWLRWEKSAHYKRKAWLRNLKVVIRVIGTQKLDRSQENEKKSGALDTGRGACCYNGRDSNTCSNRRIDTTGYKFEESAVT